MTVKQFFDNARNEFAIANLDWSDGALTIRTAVVHSYTFVATHSTLAQFTAAGGMITASALMTNRSVGPAAVQGPTTGGVLDADPVGLGVIGPVGGNPPHSILCYHDNGGDPATSRLIFFIGTGGNVPKILTGLDETVVWSGGTNRIAKL